VYAPLLKILYPVVWAVNWVTNGLLRMLGVGLDDEQGNALTREELRTVVSEAGAMIPERSQTMLLAILDLENATVEDIMIPRNEVDGIDIQDSQEEIINAIKNAAYSRVPLYDGSIDSIHITLTIGANVTGETDVTIAVTSNLEEEETLSGDWEQYFTGIADGGLLEGEPPSLLSRDLDQTREHSPLLPFDPVCDDRYVYVHLGPAVAALERDTGKLAFYAPEGVAPGAELETHVDELLAKSPGARAATVADGVLYFDRALFDSSDEPLPYNALFAFDVNRRQTIWAIRLKGEGPKSSALPIFFRGAPAVHGGIAFAGSHDKHLYAIDIATGEQKARFREAFDVCCTDATRSRRISTRSFIGRPRRASNSSSCRSAGVSSSSARALNPSLV